MGAVIGLLDAGQSLEQIAALGGDAPPLQLVGMAAEHGLGQTALSAGLGVVTTLQGLLPLGLEAAISADDGGYDRLPLPGTEVYFVQITK